MLPVYIASLVLHNRLLCLAWYKEDFKLHLYNTWATDTYTMYHLCCLTWPSLLFHLPVFYSLCSSLSWPLNFRFDLRVVIPLPGMEWTTEYEARVLQKLIKQCNLPGLVILSQSSEQEETGAPVGSQDSFASFQVCLQVESCKAYLHNVCCTECTQLLLAASV